MTREELKALRRLMWVADSATPRVRREVMAALREAQRRVSPRMVELAVSTQDGRLAAKLDETLPSDLRQAVRSLRRVFARAMTAEVVKLRASGVRVRLGMTDPAVARAARQNGAAMVTRVTSQTKKAIAAAIARASREGLSVEETAALVRPLIGLTERQAAAVLAKRSALLARGISRQEAGRMAFAYAQRLLSQRAMSIARTETVRALTAGRIAAWSAAQRRGQMPLDVDKVWVVTPDDRLCPSCRQMEGATAPISESFSTEFGDVDGPPLHPMCRCSIEPDLSSVSRRQRRAA